MSKSNFPKRNVVTVTLSDKEKQKLKIMAEYEEMSLAE